MARIDIKSAGATLNDGVLQLENGVAMDTTLRNVADQNNTTSPLKLSTTAVQVVSPFRITTDDPSDMYLDCEDGSANNRFNITRNTASQQVNLNFASNPVGSTSIVGGIRTFVDGVNLTEVMKFREDGQLQIGSTAASAMYWDNVNNRLGVGTNAPTQTLSVNGNISATSLSLTGTLQSTGTGDNYLKGSAFTIQSAVNNTDNSLFISTASLLERKVLFLSKNLGSYGRSDLYLCINGDALATNATIADTKAVFRANGNISIGTQSDLSARLGVRGSGSTSATTSLLVQNSSGTELLRVRDDGAIIQSTGSTTLYNGLTVLFSGINATAGLIQTTGAITATGDGNRIGKLQILTTGNAGSTGYGITVGSQIDFQGYNDDYTNGGIGTAIASQFLFRRYDNNQFNLNSPAIDHGILTIANTGFSSGNSSNLRGNTLWIKPTYNLTSAGLTGTIVRGIYYDPTLTSLTNTTHYGIQTTSGGAYINTTTPQASACLQADSTTQGFLPPRMTNAQRAAITTPAIGLMVYCTDAVEGVYVYKSTGWTFVA